MAKAKQSHPSKQADFFTYPAHPLHLPVRLMLYPVAALIAGSITYMLFDRDASYLRHLLDSLALVIILDWLAIAGYWIRRGLLGR